MSRAPGAFVRRMLPRAVQCHVMFGGEHCAARHCIVIVVSCSVMMDVGEEHLVCAHQSTDLVENTSGRVELRVWAQSLRASLFAKEARGALPLRPAVCQSSAVLRTKRTSNNCTSGATLRMLALRHESTNRRVNTIYRSTCNDARGTVLCNMMPFPLRR